VSARFEQREPSGPWRWHQPRYEKLVYRGPGRFFLVAPLPSGRRIGARLASVSIDFDPPAARRNGS
jgi:hypothetical protein